MARINTHKKIATKKKEKTFLIAPVKVQLSQQGANSVTLKKEG